MVRYSRVRVGSRILLLLLVVLALFFGSLIWFDYLNLLDVKEFFAPVFKLVGIKTAQPLTDKNSEFLLEDERRKKLEESLTIWEEELENWSQELTQKEEELNQMAAAVNEKDAAINEREKSLSDRENQYDSKNKNLRSVSQILTSMTVEDAVSHLQEMEDQDIIDLLRMTDAIALENEELSYVSIWLANMDAERAASIERKMIKKPDYALSGDAG